MATFQLSSLEDQCLLHLICHLEEYTPETLASLPLRLRRRLLLNLPAVDVCQLEDTAVTDGIDMEVSVWKELLGGQIKPNMKTRQQSCSYKTGYFNSISNSLLDDSSCTVAKQLLFCLPAGSLGTATLHPSLAVVCLGDSQFALSTPLRHVKHFSQQKSQVLLMAFVLGKCNSFPDSVEVACDRFALTELWLGRDTISLPMLKQFFSNIRSLSIHGNNEEQIDIPRFLLTLVLSNPHPLLSSLTLGYTVSFIRHVVADATVFFSPAPTTFSNDALRSFYPRLLPSVPYSGLSSFEIKIAADGTDLSVYFPEDEEEVHQHLQSLILYQSSLSSVTLTGWDSSGSPPTSLSDLYSILGSLFHQPQFQKLRMTNVSMDWWQLSSLVQPFLAAYVEGNNKKMLEIVGVELFTYDLRPESIATTIVAIGLASKSLVISKTRFPDQNCIGPLFTWLSCFPCVGAFTFTSPNRSTTIPYDGDDTPIALCRGSSALKEFVIVNTSLKLGSSNNQAFESLFGGLCLQQVALKFCRIGTDGLLPALTQGLVMQASVGRLFSLRLDGNALGRTPDSDLVAFFDALFHLPQLTKLVVSIRFNQFKSKHYSLLYESWVQNAAGKRLKKLCLDSGSDYESHVSELNELAAILCH